MEINRQKEAVAPLLPYPEDKTLAGNSRAVSRDDHRPADVVGGAVGIVGITISETPVGDSRGVAEINLSLVVDQHYRAALNLILLSWVSQIASSRERAVNTVRIREGFLDQRLIQHHIQFTLRKNQRGRIVAIPVIQE